MRDSPLAADILQRIVGLLQASRRGAGRAVGPSDDVLSSNIEELHKQACLSGLDASEVELAFQLALGGGMSPHDADRLLKCVLPRDAVSTKAVLAIVSASGASRGAPSAGKDQVDFGTQRFALFQLATLLRNQSVSPVARAALQSLYTVLEASLVYCTLREPTAAILAELGEARDVQLHRLDKLQERVLPPGESAQAESIERLLDDYRSHDVQPQPVYPPSGADVAVKPDEEPAAFLQWSSDYLRLRERLEILPSVLHERTLEPSWLDEHTLPQDPLRLLDAEACRAKTPRTRPKDLSEMGATWANILHVGFENDVSYQHRCSYHTNVQLLRHLHHGQSADSPDAVAGLLRKMRDVCSLGGELLEGNEPFLPDYLTKWDGLSHQHLVFELIALLKPFDIAQLENHYLQPLRTLSRAASATEQFLTDLVSCLKELVMSWASRDDWAIDAARITVFGALDSDYNYVESLQHLLQFAGEVIESAVLRFSRSLVLRAAALDFYELALDLPITLGLPVLTLPSPTLTYVCLLSTEAASLSRICGIIGSLREALTGPNSALDKQSEYSARLVVSLNRIIVDFVNTLWQKKLLKSQGQAEAFNLNSDEIEVLRGYVQARSAAGSGSLGLTTHPALAKLARTCLDVLARQSGRSATVVEGAVTAASLKQAAEGPEAIYITWSDFRPRFLEWGKALGLDGLADLLFASLASLLAFRVSQESQT